jgi:deazaflavin-dependent oxidoreductase (nitroreductase family)
MASWAERHLVNRAVRVGLRLGRDIDGLQELGVRGRRSGKRRRTPVKVLEVDGRRYIVSLTGSSGWVCNLRASPRARLRFGRRVEEVVVSEIPDRDKPPVVRAYLAAATRPETSRRLEWAGEGAPEAEVLRQAARFPVFRITCLPEGEPRPAS